MLIYLIIAITTFIRHSGHINGAVAFVLVIFALILFIFPAIEKILEY